MLCFNYDKYQKGWGSQLLKFREQFTSTFTIYHFEGGPLNLRLRFDTQPNANGVTKDQSQKVSGECDYINKESYNLISCAVIGLKKDYKISKTKIRIFRLTNNQGQ